MATDLTTHQINQMIKKTTHCPLCGQRAKAKHLDHIVPINIGGTHTHGNVRVICATCNLRRPHDGSDLKGHQPTLWATDHRAAQVATVLRTRRPKRIGPPPSVRRRQTKARIQRELWTLKARTALALRRHGIEWQHIADELGYGSPGAVHNSIRLRLGVNPKAIFKPQGTP